MNDAPAFASRHPALRGLIATERAARVIERTAFRFTHRPALRTPSIHERTR